MNKSLLPLTTVLLTFLLIGFCMDSAFAQFTPTLYRALNLNGSALTIDGNNWESSLNAPNFSYTTNGWAIEEQGITLSPTTDANRATMIRSSLWGHPIQLNLTSVPNGSYDVYIYVWEDNDPTTFSLSLEGTIVLPTHNSGNAGSWSKLGPFRTTITDGSINVTTSGGHANVSGIEIWTAPGPPPVVSSPVTDHLAILGEGFNFTLPSNTFTDPDPGTVLTYTATLYNGSTLPSWLIFNTTTRTFSGTASSGNAGALNIMVTATDPDGGSASDVFMLTVNTEVYSFYRAINLNGSSLSVDGNTWEGSGEAANLSISNNQTFSDQTLPLNPLTDANRSTMIRSSIWGSLNLAVSAVPVGNYAVWVYVLEDNSPINFSFSLEGTIAQSNYNSGTTGTWAKLGPFLRTINDGAINLSVTGDEGILSGIEIYTVNSPPVVASAIVDQSATAGQPFSYIVPSNTFSDPDAGTVLTYVATLSNSSPLPSWLSFNAATRSFSGTPGSGDVGIVNVRVTASDGEGGTANDIFTLTVNPPVNSTLYRALNLNGTALTIDGNNWESSIGAPNFSYTTNGWAFEQQGTTLIPTTDANRTTMIRSSLWGDPIQLSITSVPNGSYDVYMYVWEDNEPTTFSLSLEGAIALPSHNSGSAGSWSKLGPFRVSITDGSINVSTDGGHANISGIEIYSITQSSVVLVTGVSLLPATLNLTPGQTEQVSHTITPANATNKNVNWHSSNESVATVNNVGLVTAVGAGTATMTVTTVDGAFTDQTVVTIEEFTTESNVFEKFAFQYKYDERKRMSHKKVPGADWVYMVYDDRDRLVMTQDGNQRDDEGIHQWLFTKYDELNRPILTGIYSDTENLDQSDMQLKVNNFYTAADAPNTPDEWFELKGTTVHGYTNQSFPNVSTPADYLTVTYYDDYTFKSLITTNTTDFNYDNDQLITSGSDEGQEDIEFTRVQGQVTATQVKNLDTDEFLWSVNYYDDHYRVIQNVSQNSKGGIDKMTNVYDFVGKILRTKTDHTTTGANALSASTTRKLTYDHVGRLLKTQHQTGGSAPVILARNEYNELGQLVTKRIHSADISENENVNNYMQQIDYRYNIRGWLTRINDSNLSSVDGGPKDYFGMELGYNESIGVGGELQYNGNIHAMKWSTNLGLGFNDEALEIFETTQRGYAFSYDPMNRLKSALHKENQIGWNSSLSYREDGVDYDLNGNIQKLNRSGKGGFTMDVLDYDYSGNQLRKVEDDGNIQEGFKDGNTTGDDYIYDLNGNMITDRNKDIETIEYNHLNLPSKVIKTNGEYIKYVYNAAGTKLSQQVYDASDMPVKSTDYLGEFFYENDTLRFINHEEGRIIMKTQYPEYQYTLRDHLGNTRITFTSKGQDGNYAVANMNAGSEEEEQNVFGAYNSFTNAALDPTPNQIEGDKILILNGGHGGQVGLTKSFAVVPGDNIAISVYAKYLTPTGNPSNLLNFAAELTEAFALSPNLPGEATTAFEALNSLGSFIAGGGRDDDENEPKGFLNIVLFDKDYNLVDFAYRQITATDLPNDTIGLKLKIRQPGFAYVFLSNESPTLQQIGFDTFVVAHHYSNVIQQDDYYPFGLTFNSYNRENSVANDYKYNGKEEQRELELGWLDYGKRMYQPDLGRFFTQDRYASKYFDTSPYSYASNNPALYVDINGDSVWITSSSRMDKKGNVTVTHTINVTGKVLKDGTGNTSASSLASGLNSRMNAQSSKMVTKDANGNSVTVNVKMNVNFTAANSMSDVSKSDHLIVMVNNVEGKADPNLGGGEAGGLASSPGKIAYIESSGSGVVETALHETGHMMGLTHPTSNSTDDPMSYTGRGANFSPQQMDKMLDNAPRGNQGSNFGIMKDYFPGVSRGSYNPSTNTRPFQVAPDQRAKIPLPLVNKTK